jgi:hypothetical protein
LAFWRNGIVTLAGCTVLCFFIFDCPGFSNHLIFAGTS